MAVQEHPSRLIHVVEEHKFNDDLLLSEQDRDYATALFPALIHVLDDPDLRELFKVYDEPAKRAKRIRRRCGLIVILLAVLALFGASAEPLYIGIPSPWPMLIGGISACLGIVSVLIGAFGLFDSKSKSRWLCNRLMTERLRQFHFQGIVSHIPTVLTAMETGDGPSEFRDARKKWLVEFQTKYEGKLDGELTAVLADNPVSDFWLHDDDDWTPPKSADANLEKIFHAYELLRFGHQVNYANYMLGQSIGVSPTTSGDQLKWTKSISMICIFLIFVIHFIIAVLLMLNLDLSLQKPWISVLVVWVAIIALATRALEEGLQPAREVERYTEYRSSLLQLLSQYKQTSDPSDKISIMRETERVSYQEMRGFLKTNEEARFLI
jgi:hypothetical protein